MKRTVNPKEILSKRRVLLKGHFLLASGLHSEYYFQKFRILEDPRLVCQFAKKITQKFKGKVDIVCGPTTGGMLIAYEVARQMGCRFIFAERTSQGIGRKIGRGFEIKEGDKILIVDDVLTTGGSIKETIDALKEFPGKIVGISVFIDRSETGDILRELNIKTNYYSVVKIPVKNYNPKECPLCSTGIELSIMGGSR